MTFTICSLNLNGIRAAQKKGFSDWLSKHKPDYLCLQELRAWQEQVGDELISPEGYNTCWVNAEKKGYAGVALFTRKPVDQYHIGSNLEWGDREGRTLRGDFAELGKLTVVSKYIPSGSSGEERLAKKYEFLDHTLSYTRKLIRSKHPVAICGDFNIAHQEIDIHNPKGNAKNSGFLPEERQWFSKLLAQGWVDVLRELNPDTPGLYSWWSNRGQARAKDRGWRLDYILCSPSLAKRAKRAWIQKDAGLSDHAPVWVEFESE